MRSSEGAAARTLVPRSGGADRLARLVRLPALARFARLAGATVAATMTWLWLAAPVLLAASPSPSVGPAGDPRSSGQGPGLVGDPLLAIGIVLALGLGALGATLLYVRATGGPRET